MGLLVDQAADGNEAVQLVSRSLTSQPYAFVLLVRLFVRGPGRFCSASLRSRVYSRLTARRKRIKRVVAVRRRGSRPLPYCLVTYPKGDYVIGRKQGKTQSASCQPAHAHVC